MGSTILILTAHTGAGHDSVATGLAQALQHVAPADVRIVAPIGNVIATSYHWALNCAPELWGALYRLTDNGPAMVATRRALGACSVKLASILDEERPDLIVSVHSLCAQVASCALRQGGYGIPHHCIVTDLVDVHRSWIRPDIIRYYVATPAARQVLVNHHVAPERIAVTGIPLRSSFWCGAVWRRMPMFPAGQHGQSARLRCLVMDGGHPGPHLMRTVKALTHAGLRLDVRVACGRSNVLVGGITRDIRGCTLSYLAPEAEIADQMREADIVVTKAGSVTIAEALAMGCPLLLHRAAPGQEASNPGLLESMGAGIFVPTGNALRMAIRRLNASPHKRETMARCAAQAGRPAAAQAVAAMILESLGHVPALLPDAATG